MVKEGSTVWRAAMDKCGRIVLLVECIDIIRLGRLMAVPCPEGCEKTAAEGDYGVFYKNEGEEAHLLNHSVPLDCCNIWVEIPMIGSREQCRIHLRECFKVEGSTSRDRKSLGLSLH